jgi:hypothetical protein
MYDFKKILRKQKRHRPSKKQTMYPEEPRLTQKRKRKIKAVTAAHQETKQAVAHNNGVISL